MEGDLFDFIDIVQFFGSVGCVQFTAKFMNDENGYKCTYTYNGYTYVRVYAIFVNNSQALCRKIGLVDKTVH